MGDQISRTGTYHAVDGTDPSDVSDGTWELSDDEKTLTLEKGTNAEVVVSVRTLSDTDFEFFVDLSDEADLPVNTIAITSLLS